MGYSIGWGPHTTALFRRQSCQRMAEAFRLARLAHTQARS